MLDDDPGVDEIASRTVRRLPQMNSDSNRELTALCALAQHFGRPGTPTDQAWIEPLFGHLKMERPRLLAIEDSEALRAELAVLRSQHSGVRLHAGIGYVIPDDEHEGRGQAIRMARDAGLEEARLRASPTIAPDVKQHRLGDPPMLANSTRICDAKLRHT